ncbi:MAG: response regulator [Candidatus Omnitrophota bacterium]
MRVLIVEDDQASLSYAKKVLEAVGHKVTPVDNGVSAIEEVKSQPFDVVLMDMRMPCVCGLETTRAIRGLESSGHLEQLNRGKRLHIIAYTGMAMHQDKINCLEAGMDDFLAKPTRKADLLGAVEKALKSARPPPPPRFAKKHLPMGLRPLL